jgi:glycosyltransferase involved in cell wall biosynthesis
MTPPLFSVIIPCFRAAATIGMAMRSVLDQSEADLELIIVDDGSPDGSIDIARALAGDDARVMLLRQRNAGVSAARNAGIAAARGRYLAFLDADDRWAGDALACHAAAFAADEGLGVSFGVVRFFDPTMMHPGRVSSPRGALELVDALGENLTCTASNIVVRRSTVDEVGGFDSTLGHAEDQEFIARILATTTWRVSGLPDELVHYRTSVGGLSTDLVRMEDGWQAMLRTLRILAPARIDAATPRARALFQRYLARRALRTGQPGALGHFGRALWASPAALLRCDAKRSMLTLAGALGAAVLPHHLVSHLLSR